jgi:hypothetical protein
LVGGLTADSSPVAGRWRVACAIVREFFTI